MMVKGIMDLPL